MLRLQVGDTSVFCPIPSTHSLVSRLIKFELSRSCPIRDGVEKDTWAVKLATAFSIGFRNKVEIQRERPSDMLALHRMS